jgi:hypothetical protein
MGLEGTVRGLAKRVTHCEELTHDHRRLKG